jgi:uncharacterized protein YndB with AHSA1/START domain
MITAPTFTINRDAKEILMERVFDAPRDLVWKLWTDPKMIPKWWGPRSHKTVVDKMDFRIGGEWRFIQTDENGNEFAFHGIYREILRQERISETFNFEPIGPGHELIEVVNFEDFNGKTKLISKAIYNSIEDLEGMVQSGMEAGMNETMDRFAELLKQS